MTEEELLLEAHGIKATSNRIIVLKALLGCTGPATMQMLTDEIETVDKSNVFRALTLFKEHGLVHSIEACDEGVMYELCHSSIEDKDDDIHPHFHCNICHKVFCLKGIKIPKIEYPEGFEPEEESFVVSGICPDCRNSR